MGQFPLKSGRREKCLRLKYLGELVHCGAGIPGAQREVVGGREAHSEALTATRTVGDAQVSEVRYDVRHDGRHNEDLEGRGCTTRPPAFVISSASLGTKAAYLAFTPKKLAWYHRLADNSRKDKCDAI